jgi:hypothetical protein
MSVAAGPGVGAGDDMADPVFILAAPRSFSSVVCAMLGQHPEMYGLPETHLFGDETMAGWWQRAADESHQLAHGLVRAVAQICFGEQTERSVAAARAWLQRRRSETSGIVLEQLACAVFPRTLVDKSPSMVYRAESMHRARRFFPEARFIHLVRHPRGYCESVVKYMHLLARPAYRARERTAEVGVAPNWIRELASFPLPSDQPPASGEEHPVDPQGGWYALNDNVRTFLATVPSEQWVTIRGEDLLRRPEKGLADLASWLGKRTDRSAIEQMMHPERSPYAHFGPRGARNGNDILFLEQPTLRAARGRPRTLAGPPSWRPDRNGLEPEVVELARSFGYD